MLRVLPVPSARSRLICASVLAILIDGSARALDCNQNGVEDRTDIETGRSADCDANRVPDECELASIVLEPMPLGLDENHTYLIARDFDGDGDPDLVASSADLDLGGITLLRNGCPDFTREDFPAPPATNVIVPLDVDGPPPSCADSADADDDGRINVTDVIVILRYLFAAGPPPAEPGPPPAPCSVDRGAELGCEKYPACN